MSSADLPDIVQAHLGRVLPHDAGDTRAVRLRQSGEMWMKPGGRAMRFDATEDFAVERVAFSWRARFPILGPLGMRVVDEYADGAGGLRVSLLGIPIQTDDSSETSLGEAMRYLAELVWAPHAVAANRELEWREVDERSVEVSCTVGQTSATVRWDFDDDGDPMRATGRRPFPTGKTYVPRQWGGNFGNYRTFGHTRIPGAGEAWWELPGGRFVYWRGRVTAVELLEQPFRWHGS